MIREGIRVRLVAACVVLMTAMLAACTDDSGPAITGSPAKTAIVGEAYRFQPKAINMGKALHPRFSIANKPSWASFDDSSGQLSGTPAASQVGVFSDIAITAVAGPVHAVLPSFSITVLPASAAVSSANAVTLYWQAPTDNTDGSQVTNLSGYKIYYGETPRNYSSTIKVSNPGLTTYVVENLPAGQYYFAMTAYNALGDESDFSAEVSTVVD